MELPGAASLYALAGLAMAFAGFTAIVVVLRQSTGMPLSPLHILFTLMYIELGLMAAAFAMLAPVAWRVSSALVLIVLGSWLFFFPIRRLRAAPADPLPARFFVMCGIGVAVVVALGMNAAGTVFPSGPGPIALAAVYMLAVASVIFLRNFSSYLRV